MEELLRYIKCTLLQLIGLTVVGAAVFYAVGLPHVVLGWCIGSGINIVYFAMLGSRSARAVKLPPECVVQFIRGGFALRFIVVCLAMIIIVQFPVINFWGAVGGCFSYRLVVFADAAWTHIHVRKRKEV